MNILILIIGVSGLIPEYKADSYWQINYGIEQHILYSSNVPDRSLTKTLSFGYTFRDIPQVAISVYLYSYQAGLPFGCSIEVISTSTTDFTFKATEYIGQIVYMLHFDWYAFNDESIEIINFKLEKPTMVIGLNTIPKTRKLANKGILILNGFLYTKDPNFYAEIIDVTETDFVVQLTDPASCLTWVSYYAVFGHKLNVWSQGLYKIVPFFTPDYGAYDEILVFPDNWFPFQKFAIVGFIGFYEWPGENVFYFTHRLNENSLNYGVGYWGDEIYEARIQILIYRLLEFEQSCPITPDLL